MEHYVKSKNVEIEPTKESLPLEGLPEDFTWMKVRAGSKLKNLITPADKSLKESEVIVISGYGAAVSKVVSLAEIVKRKNAGCHQYNKIAYRTVEEYWDPKDDTSDLSQLKVVRDIPEMYIALTKAVLITGMQQQEPLKVFLNVPQNQKPRNKRRRPNAKKEIQELGMKDKKNGPAKS